MPPAHRVIRPITVHRPLRDKQLSCPQRVETAHKKNARCGPRLDRKRVGLALNNLSPSSEYTIHMQYT